MDYSIKAPKMSTTEQTNKKWYVLRVASGKEKKVKEYIEMEVKRVNLEDYVSRIIIPTEKTFQIRNKKKVVKEKNFYPGYIFVEANLIGEVYHLLRNIPNVISFVGAERGKKPIPLRSDEVKRILGIVDKLSESEEKPEEQFFVGEEVKIIDGAFADFIGVVEEVNDEKKKLKVSVKIFGRKTPIDLNFHQVEKVI